MTSEYLTKYSGIQMILRASDILNLAKRIKRPIRPKFARINTIH